MKSFVCINEESSCDLVLLHCCGQTSPSSFIKNLEKDSLISSKSTNDFDEKASYDQLMPTLRGNWESPVSYLKKRGYIPPDRIENEKLKVEARKLFGRSGSNNNFKSNIEMEPIQAFPQKKKKDSNLDLTSKAVVREETSPNNEQKSQEKSPGFISHMKNKILDIFGAGSKALNDLSYADIDEYAEDGLNSNDLNRDEFDASDGEDFANLEESPILLTPEISSYDYIDPLDDIKQESRNIFPRSVCQPPISINMNTTPIGTSSAAGSPTSTITVDSLNDLVKNLSSADMQYVTSFVKCFKDTRKLLPDGDKYVATTTKPTEFTTSAAIASTKEQISSSTTERANLSLSTLKPTTNKTTVPSNITFGLDINQCDGNGKGSTSNNISKGSLPTIFSTPPTIRNQSIPPNSETKMCSLAVNKTNLLSFLAHLHHQVDQVGKLPPKPLDMKKVERMIEKSHEIMVHGFSSCDSVVLGSGSSTQSTPLQLNDMSFDLEWKSLLPTILNNKKQRTKGVTNDDADNILDFPYETQVSNNPSSTLAERFLKELPKTEHLSFLESPYADNFIDQQPSLQKQKRQILSDDKSDAFDLSPSITDSGDKKMAEVLSDVSSSLSHFNSRYDDYFTTGESSNNDHNKPFISKNDNSLTTRDGQGSIASLRRKGKRRKKPKSSDEKAYDEVVDIRATEDLSDNKKIEDIDEINSIHFRVSADQEEDIAKFIANLDAPPEIFNFDVDKYLRSAKNSESKVVPSNQFESSIPERTFYEFVGTPDLEKENIPLINGLDYMSTVAKDYGKQKKAYGKRDLLRQYIKGLSSVITHNHNKDPFDLKMDDIDQIFQDDPVESDKTARSSQFSQNLKDRTNELINSYGSNYKALNYIKSVDKHTNNDPVANDDFIDHYYNLNDGSMPLYKTNTYQTIGNMNPSNVEIQLDLDKKFRDLHLGNDQNNYQFKDDLEVTNSDLGQPNTQMDYYPPLGNYGTTPDVQPKSSADLHERKNLLSQKIGPSFKAYEKKFDE